MAVLHYLPSKLRAHDHMQVIQATRHNHMLLGRHYVGVNYVNVKIKIPVLF
jgi:hypothetical protein